MVGCRSTGNGRKTPLEPVGRVGQLELAGLDTRFKHARLTATRGRRISKTPAASTAGPFLSSLAFSVTSLWKSMEKGRNWKRKSNKNLPRKLEKSTLKAKKSMPGGGLGALGGDLGKKNGQEAVLADLGRFWTGAGGPKWQQDDRTWRQDAAKLARFWPIRARPKFTKICQDSF